MPCPPPGDLPNPGIKPTSLMSPALADEFFYHSRHLRRTKKLDESKNNCVGALRANSGPKITKRPKNSPATYTEWGVKAGFYTYPLHSTPQRGGQTPMPPLWPNSYRLPYKEAVHPPLGERARNLLTFLSPSKLCVRCCA